MFREYASKIKIYLTRALTFTLAISMCLYPLTASAVGNVGGNTGGGMGGMGTTTDAKAWSPNYQGYRIYVLNSNLERISPTYDFVYSNPVGVGEVLSFTRFDTSSSPDEHYIEPISTLQQWCNAAKGAPTPTKKVNGVRVGNGEEFKEWFFAGKEGFEDPLFTNNNKNGGNAGTKDTDGDGIPYTEDQD